MLTLKSSGRFAASRARGIDLLSQLGLVSDVNDSPDYSVIVASAIRNRSYSELWKSFLQGTLYDVRLIDESFIQFVAAPNESFYFYDSPVKAIAFEQFAADQLGAQWEDESDADVLQVLRADYERYLTSLDFEHPATPIRYDYSPNQYRCACHPAAHLHFGFSNEMRMATKRRWTPEAFAMFVVRQFFPNRWDRFLERGDVRTTAAAVRDNLEQVVDEHWGDRHEAEVYIV